MKTLDPSLTDHLRCVLDDHIERANDHLAWLSTNTDEPDRALQLADTERMIELDRQLIALLDTTGEA